MVSRSPDLKGVVVILIIRSHTRILKASIQLLSEAGFTSNVYISVFTVQDLLQHLPRSALVSPVFRPSL